jgi:signal transduction histidine kinase
MKIKNKILLTTFAVMLFSLVLFFGIGSIVIWLFSGDIGDSGMPTFDQNAFLIEDAITVMDQDSADWAGNAAILEKDNYRLYVTKGDTIVFSNLSHNTKPLISILKKVPWLETGKSCYVAGTTIVGKEVDGYRIAAVKRDDKTDANGKRVDQFETVLNAFLIIGSSTIIVILLIGQIFSSWMVKWSLRPIRALTEGAQRIMDGNLSEPVIYDGRDELSHVCAVFNQMQSHLKDEKDRDAAYEKSRTDMIAGISHDLRTPLTSVKGYIKGLRDGIVTTPEKREQYLTIAYNKATEMEVLLQNLFYFSKLETGNLPLSLTEEDMGVLVKIFARQSRVELLQNNVNIRLDIRTGENPVKVDTEQIHRLLMNLTNNSLKYAGTEDLTLTISVWNEGDRVHLVFADNGKGVPEDKLSSLFIQFWRGDESRSSKSGGGGSGLGLNIVKHIVEMHGGTVRARNENGLVIDILLPAGERTI